MLAPTLDHCGRSCPFWLQLNNKVDRSPIYIDGLKVGVLQGQFDNRSISFEPGKGSLNNQANANKATNPYL